MLQGSCSNGPAAGRTFTGLGPRELTPNPVINNPQKLLPSHACRPARHVRDNSRNSAKIPRTHPEVSAAVRSRLSQKLQPPNSSLSKFSSFSSSFDYLNWKLCSRSFSARVPRQLACRTTLAVFTVTSRGTVVFFPRRCRRLRPPASTRGSSSVGRGGSP